MTDTGGPRPVPGTEPLVTHVDGNAIAGELAEIFRSDMTIVSGECRNCGDVTVLARALVERDDTGFIVRCSGCEHVLFTVVHGPTRTWVDLQGICGLEFPRA